MVVSLERGQLTGVVFRLATVWCQLQLFASPAAASDATICDRVPPQREPISGARQQLQLLTEGAAAAAVPESVTGCVAKATKHTHTHVARFLFRTSGWRINYGSTFAGAGFKQKRLTAKMNEESCD